MDSVGICSLYFFIFISSLGIRTLILITKHNMYWNNTHYPLWHYHLLVPLIGVISVLSVCTFMFKVSTYYYNMAFNLIIVL